MIGKYDPWSFEALADSFEKVLVSFDDLTYPLHEGFRRMQAWKLTEPL